MEVLGRFWRGGVFEHASSPFDEDIAYFSGCREEEFAALVDEVHAPVCEVMMQFRFEGDRIIGAVEHVYVVSEGNGCVAQ